MVDRYGEWIEADLHRVYGLDLLDFFRGRHSWRKLVNLLSKLRLSDRSLYVQAQNDDPEYGEWVVSLPEGPPQGPPLGDWTPDHEALTGISDRIGSLIQAVVASGGNKAPVIPPSRRPVTAAEKARARQRRQRHSALVDEVREAQERWAAQHPT